MKRTLTVIAMLVVVSVILAGGTAFFLQQQRLDEFRRLAAQAKEKMDAEQYAEAATLLNQVEARGGTAQSAAFLGRALYEQGKQEEAVKLFDKVLERYRSSPHAAEASLYKGRYALEVKKDTKEAMEDFLKVLEGYPKSTAADFALLHLAQISYNAGDVHQAKKNLDHIMKRTDSPARSDAEFLLGDINMKQLTSPEPGPDDMVYVIKKGDSIWEMQRKLKVPGDLIVGINKLKPQSLTIGRQIKIPRLDISVIVDKTARTLTVKNNGVFLKKYRVGINRSDTRVPPGDYSVQTKSEKGEEYTDPATNVTLKADDPANPHGSRFLQLKRDVGIHGSNSPASVGNYIAKGSIAMRNEDIEEIYPIVNVGTPVTIRGKSTQEEKR